MVSTFTTNKHIEEPATGDYINTWATPVNSDWSALDSAFGGTTNLNVTGASGTNVLSVAQYQPLILSIAGTLTANVIYQVPSGIGGQWIVNNASTGAFSITLNSGGGGASVVCQQGYITAIYSDGTNVYRTTTVPFASVTKSVTSVTTLTTADFGKFIEISNGPYTVILPTPVGNNGTFTLFLNTAAIITISTPAGAFVGQTGNGTANQSISTSTSGIYFFNSDGVNWVLYGLPKIDNGGNISTGGNITAAGTIKSGVVGINTFSTNYTLVASDSGQVVWPNSLSNLVVTVPNTLPIGFRTMILRTNSGAVTLSPGAGITLQSRTGNFSILQTNGSASLLMVNATVGIVDGNI